MKAIYLFTDIECKKMIGLMEFEGCWDYTPGEKAEEYRLKLQRKLKKPVICWCHTGLHNQYPII